MKSKWNTAIVTLVFAVMLIFVGGGRIDAQAASVGSGSGNINSSNRTRSYTLNLPSSGRISLTYDSKISQSEIYIEDRENPDGEIVWREYPKEGKKTYQIDLIKGSYTLYIKGRYNSDSNTGSFSFSTDFTSAGESFSEPNNRISEAPKASFNRRVYGQLACNDENDIYKYELSSAGRVTLTFDSEIRNQKIYFEDAGGEKVWGTEYPKEGSTVYQIDLTAGTYYFNVEKRYLTDEYNGNYNYFATFSSAGESFAEPNNSPTSASVPALGRTVYGQIASNDDTDVYRYTFSSARKLTLQFNSGLENVEIYLTDASGKKVWGREYPKTGSTRYDIDVSGGTYYFYVERRYADETGNYNFVLGNYTQPQQNSSSSVTTTKPKKTQISRIVSKGGRKIVVTWKAKSGVSGYQIQCSLKKNFKKGVKTYTIKGKKKTSKTIKKLKAQKKYFVRVRSFTKTKVNGKTKKIYSKWSKVKKVKVKR